MRAFVAVALFCACSRPSPTITNDPVKAPAPPAPAPAPSPTTKTESSFCDDDSECAFDDPCLAKACVSKSDAGPFVGCDKSAPPPGRCVCGGHRCTLVRNSPKSGSAKTGCASNDECAYVPETGSCAKGASVSYIDRRGGFCTCDAGTCTPEFIDAIPCKTSADCSWLEGPRRPAPASKVPRPHPPITPCAGGSFDSVCHAGTCALRQWKC